MYNIMLVSGVLHSDLTLHILLNDHHNKCTNHLSPYKFITILLIIFLMLLCYIPWFIYCVVYFKLSVLLYCVNSSAIYLSLHLSVHPSRSSTHILVHTHIQT